MSSLPKNPGPQAGAKYILGEAPCVECQRPTRSMHMKKAEHPGTLVRKGRGMCNRCYERVMVKERAQATELKFPILKCTVEGCDAMTRSTRDNAALAPGTRRRVSKGRCTSCYEKQHVVVPAEKVEAARTELDTFLAARQKRQAAAARRQQTAQRFGLAS